MAASPVPTDLPEPLPRTANLKRELTARGIAVTDLLPLLVRSSYLRFDGHFSEEGTAESLPTSFFRCWPNSDGTRSRQPTRLADPGDRKSG